MITNTDWVADLEQLHGKYGDLPTRVRALTPARRQGFYQFRLRFLQEELAELVAAASPADAVDAMIDLCVVAIGTLHAFGVDARAAWDCVHRANMAKQPGVNPRRPNPFQVPDLIKPPGWQPPDHRGNIGWLPARDELPVDQVTRPAVVCLCGSTRFRAAYEEAQRAETLAGRIVLSVGLFGHAEGLTEDSPVKAALDELHLRKIDLAGEVLVLNVGGYLGKSTTRELAYARSCGKVIRFLESPGEGE